MFHVIRALIISFSFFAIGCFDPGDFDKSAADGLPRGYDVNRYPMNKLVCDPLGGEDVDQGLVGGLKADLYYLEDGKTFSSVKDVIANGTVSGQFYFFSHLNVPTRLFSTGFPLQTGGVVKDNTGQELIENFALRFRTILQLSPNDEPGYYQLATLSDDGSVLRARNSAGVYEDIVNNDGNHPTRFGCGSVLYLDHQSEIPMVLDYAQGPRYHISVIPMWRKINGNVPPTEPSCGKTGNEIWFDYRGDGSPKSAYTDLLSRGWKPIAAGNYQLPLTAAFNPCAGGTSAQISNLELRQENYKIIATWQTNVPATSQLRYINMDSGTDLITYSDNVLRTQHKVVTPATDPGPYKVRAISITDSYGKAISAEQDVFVTDQ